MKNKKYPWNTNTFDDLKTDIPRGCNVEISALKKSFTDDEGSSFAVLQDINLTIQEGEFVALFGPNGCGKSTLLKILAGLDLDWKGSVKLNNTLPNKISCGYVFQDFSNTLFPWRTNLDNVSIPLELMGLSLEQSRIHARNFVRALNTLHIDLNKYPYRSNLGEQQLVSILRAFVFLPQLILLDEPLSSLDFRNQINLRRILEFIWQEKKQTIVFVSHSLDDAILLANRLIVLSPRPSHVLLDLQINLPRPRTIEVEKTREFINIETKVREKLINASMAT